MSEPRTRQVSAMAPNSSNRSWPSAHKLMPQRVAWRFRTPSTCKYTASPNARAQGLFTAHELIEDYATVFTHLQHWADGDYAYVQSSLYFLLSGDLVLVSWRPLHTCHSALLRCYSCKNRPHSALAWCSTDMNTAYGFVESYPSHHYLFGRLSGGWLVPRHTERFKGRRRSHRSAGGNISASSSSH